MPQHRTPQFRVHGKTIEFHGDPIATINEGMEHTVGADELRAILDGHSVDISVT